MKITYFLLSLVSEVAFRWFRVFLQMGKVFEEGVGFMLQIGVLDDGFWRWFKLALEGSEQKRTVAHREGAIWMMGAAWGVL